MLASEAISPGHWALGSRLRGCEVRLQINRRCRDTLSSLSWMERGKSVKTNLLARARGAGEAVPVRVELYTGICTTARSHLHPEDIEQQQQDIGCMPEAFRTNPLT